MPISSFSACLLICPRISPIVCSFAHSLAHMPAHSLLVCSFYHSLTACLVTHLQIHFPRLLFLDVFSQLYKRVPSVLPSVHLSFHLSICPSICQCFRPYVRSSIALRSKMVKNTDLSTGPLACLIAGRSHRSLVRLLWSARFARAHSSTRSLTSLTPSLVGQLMIGWLFCLCFFSIFDHSALAFH